MNHPAETEASTMFFIFQNKNIAAVSCSGALWAPCKTKGIMSSHDRYTLVLMAMDISMAGLSHGKMVNNMFATLGLHHNCKLVLFLKMLLLADWCWPWSRCFSTEFLPDSCNGLHWTHVWSICYHRKTVALWYHIFCQSDMCILSFDRYSALFSIVIYRESLSPKVYITI